MFNYSWFWKNLLVFISMLFFTILLAVFFTLAVLTSFFQEQSEEELQTVSIMLANVISIWAAESVDFTSYLESSTGIDAIFALTDGNNIDISLYDSERNLLVSSKKYPALLEDNLVSLLLKALGKPRGHVEVFYNSVEQQYFAYCTIPIYEAKTLRTLYIVKTTIPVLSFFDILQVTATQFVFIILFVLLLSTAFSMYLLRKILLPLKVVSTAATEFAKGNFQYRVDITQSSELKYLSETLNELGKELRKRINQVTRRRNEISTILASMGEAVLVVNDELKIRNINPAAASLLGCRLKDCIGSPVKRIVENKEIIKIIKKSLEIKGRVEREILIKNKDAALGMQESGSAKNASQYAEHTFYFQVNCSYYQSEILDKRGKHLSQRVVLVLNDISHLKKLERIRKDFVGNVSHELKTPVTSIRGFLETLADGALDDRAAAHRFIDIALKQTMRLENIIIDLLSLSQIESGQEDLVEFHDSNLKALLTAVVQNSEALAEQKHMAIELQCEDNYVISVIPRLLEQALGNLIDNAIKYSPENSTIYATLKRQNACVEISIRDEGRGIAEKDIPRIFERFYRIDKARSRDMGGTGLGLAIVKHIIFLHNADISVESEEGKGSCFTIRFRKSVQ